MGPGTNNCSRTVKLSIPTAFSSNAILRFLEFPAFAVGNIDGSTPVPVIFCRNVSALPDVHRSEEWACLEFVAAGYCRLHVDSSAFWLPIGYAKPPFLSTKQSHLFCIRQVQFKHMPPF